MKRISYINFLKKSWFDLWNNLVLFLPMLVGIGIYIGFIALIAIEAAIIGFFSGFSVEAIFSLNNWAFLLIFGLIDLILIFIAGSYINSMLIGMTKDVTNKRKTSIKNMFEYGKELWLKYLKTSLLIFLIVGFPLIILFSFSFLMEPASVSRILFVSISVFMAFIYMIIMGILLLFWEPIIVYKKGGPVKTIKEAFAYARRNTKHTLVTFGIIMLISFAIGSITGFVESILNSINGFIIAVLLVFFSLFRTAVNIILWYVLRLFEFKSYISKK